MKWARMPPFLSASRTQNGYVAEALAWVGVAHAHPTRRRSRMLVIDPSAATYLLHLH